MPARRTADEARREQTREEIKEETKERRKRRYRIEISEADRYMLTRPLERLKPHERTPNESAFLKFLEELPTHENGAVIRSPGPKKRPKKLAPVKSTNRRKPASKLAKKAVPDKKYGGAKNKPGRKKQPADPPPKAAKKATKRRATWRGKV